MDTDTQLDIIQADIERAVIVGNAVRYLSYIKDVAAYTKSVFPSGLAKNWDAIHEESVRFFEGFSRIEPVILSKEELALLKITDSIANIGSSQSSADLVDMGYKGWQRLIADKLNEISKFSNTTELTMGVNIKQ